MKGKIAFVVGAAVGYVLGSRAGRERYEQIKRGAESLWQTEPVQRGVGVVRGVLDDRADELKVFIRRASSDVFANLAKHTADKPSQTTAESAPDSEPAPKAKPAAKSTPKPKTAAKSKARPAAKPKAEPTEAS